MRLILLLSCADKPGLVARISSFIYAHGGNIHSLDEYADPREAQFFIRVEWSVDERCTLLELEDEFTPLANEFNAEWEIRSCG